MQGCAYGVGVGPGDPELMTLKAVRILRESDVIVYSGKKKEECTAFRIAVQAVPEIAGKELLSISVPMTYDRQMQDTEHHKTVERIGCYLDEGKNVSFLLLGDPSIYSSFSYIRKILEENGYRTETVSAVPSFCAVAASLNIPLAEWDEQMHIIPAAHQMKPDGKQTGTCVYMKVGRQMATLKEGLKNSGADVFAVEKCGMQDERIYRGIEEMPDEAGYFATVIAKHASF